MIMQDVVDAAVAATKDNLKFQTIVRTFISELAEYGHSEEEQADQVARIVQEYRQGINDWIDAPESAEDIKERRKQVNNRINDVSRICREMTGYTIKNISRKEHTYGASKVEPKEPKSEAETSVPEMAKVEVPTFSGNLSADLTYLLDTHGDIAVAEMVAKLVDERVSDYTEAA